MAEPQDTFDQPQRDQGRAQGQGQLGPKGVSSRPIAFHSAALPGGIRAE
jgi:hypothetical protein